MGPYSIVIIGASFGGIPAAHGLLRDVLPAIPALREQSYNVTLISPSSYFYWKVGSPRTIVNPAALPIEKVLLPIADGFKAYSKEHFEFVQAYATAINHATKTVELSTDDGKTSRITYDSLVIASGTTSASPLWTLSKGSDALLAALKAVHARLPQASSVLVAGGGPAGVETAGELGQTYGGGKKEITLLSGSSRLLPRLKNAAVGKDAKARLAKQGVKVVHGVKVAGVDEVADGGKTTVTLDNGTKMVVDVYIDATGELPNNKFIPEAWLDARGYVKTDSQTLRLDVPGTKRVYCIGSAGSYSNGGLLDVKFAGKALLESIELDIIEQCEDSSSEPIPASSWLAWLTSWLPFFGSTDPARRKNIYRRITEADMQFVPIGSTQGVGAVFGYKLPSFVVRQVKSKDFMIGNAPKLVAGTG